MPSGIVKWFNAENGYGFIKHGNSGRDVFIHVKEVQKAGFSSLVDGAHVEFDIVERRGREAGGKSAGEVSSELVMGASAIASLEVG